MCWAVKNTLRKLFLGLNQPLCIFRNILIIEKTTFSTFKVIFLITKFSVLLADARLNVLYHPLQYLTLLFFRLRVPFLRSPRIYLKPWFYSILFPRFFQFPQGSHSFLRQSSYLYHHVILEIGSILYRKSNACSLLLRINVFDD